MRSADEGKLLARAGSDFYHPGGAGQLTDPSALPATVLSLRRLPAMHLDTVFRFAPIRVREKKNELPIKTPQTKQGYQDSQI
jgi:hypothetical protein